jgi:hypothetical protein
MNTSSLIDCCLGSKGAPFDVAQVANRVLAHRFRYKGDNIWEYKDDNTSNWVIDENRARIETAIKVDVCQVFMERALYWQEQSMCPDMASKIDSQLRSHRLLELCLKLNKERYVRDVIKELRAFLAVD